jgi:hypothetical protein
MAHYLTSGGKYRGMPFGDDVWSCPSGHLFGPNRVNRVRGRAASNHVNRYWRKAVEAIAAAKRRRLRREVERCARGGYSEWG